MYIYAVQNVSQNNFVFVFVYELNNSHWRLSHEWETHISSQNIYINHQNNSFLASDALCEATGKLVRPVILVKTFKHLLLTSLDATGQGKAAPFILRIEGDTGIQTGAVLVW